MTQHFFIAKLGHALTAKYNQLIYTHCTVVFWYEISKKCSASNLNYSPIGSSISFKNCRNS